jgi:hypothetical protein
MRLLSFYVLLATLAFGLAATIAFVALSASSQTRRSYELHTSEFVDGPGLLRKCDPPPSCIQRTMSAEDMARCARFIRQYCAAQLAHRMGVDR